MTKVLRNWVMAFLHPRPLIGLFYLPRFLIHYFKFANASNKRDVTFRDLQPCLGDWTTNTPFDSHYFYQGAWLARRLSYYVPERHIDIGSSVLTIGVLSAYVDTVFVDFRPIKTKLSGLTPVAGNILALTFADDSIFSLSCLHVLEHIGLGRYGDAIDPQGSHKAAAELQRVLAPRGRLYLSLPVGRERVCFNAHRVHEPASVLAMFPKMQLIEFSFVDDAGNYLERSELDQAKRQEYSCGLFVLEKL